jgi:hypothetical protein
MLSCESTSLTVLVLNELLPLKLIDAEGQKLDYLTND